MRERERDRRKTADKVVNLFCAFAEIYQAVGFFYLRCIRHLGIVLLFARRSAVSYRVYGFKEQFCAAFSELIVNILKIVVRAYLNFALHYHIARVKSDVHIHRRYPRNGLAVDYSPLHRCGSAVLREKRAVNVNTAVFRVIYHVFGQYLAVCDDDYHFGAYLRKSFGKLVTSERFRLINGYSAFFRKHFDGRRAEFVSSALRFIRLRDDADDVFTRIA